MIFERFQMVSMALWEPLGGVFAVSLIWLLLRFVFGDARKSVWAWLIVTGSLYAFFWRHAVLLRGVRYHNIFLFIALFAILGLWETFPLPRTGKRLLFIVLLGLCVARDLTFNPRDREIRQLYRRVAGDSRRFQRTIGLVYDSNADRTRYYTGLAVLGVDREIPLADLLKNLKDNLSVYDGDFDAVYLFYTTKKGEIPLLPGFLTLAPDQRIESMGEYYLDLHRKKKVAVFRYSPLAQRNVTGGGELIFNGDFAQLATEREKQGLVNGLGKRMVRWQTEPFELPAGWNFYQSWMGKTQAFATRVKRGDHYVLRLEANGYLAAIPGAFPVKAGKTISFTVSAEKDSLLQITRAGKEIGMLPILLLPLKAGTERRYDIKLSPYPGLEKNEIWFWLDHGTIELSDVRLK